MPADVLDDIERAVDHDGFVGSTPAPSAPEPGDDVWVIFWRSNEMPNGRDYGAWDLIPGRVVSVGKMIVVEVGSHLNPTYGNSDGRESPPGSALRFAVHADVFLGREAAEEACKSRPKAKT